MGTENSCTYVWEVFKGNQSSFRIFSLNNFQMVQVNIYMFSRRL